MALKLKTKDIKTVELVDKLEPFDFVLVIKDGKLKKIKVADLKKFV